MANLCTDVELAIAASTALRLPRTGESPVAGTVDEDGWTFGTRRRDVGSPRALVIEIDAEDGGAWAGNCRDVSSARLNLNRSPCLWADVSNGGGDAIDPTRDFGLWLGTFPAEAKIRRRSRLRPDVPAANWSISVDHEVGAPHPRDGRPR
jgi:hypothetical protein